MKQKQLFSIPVPSTSAIESPQYICCGDLSLQFKAEFIEKIENIKINFLSVRAVNYRAEGHCTVWHINAYDTVMEVENSTWLQELKNDNPKWFQEWAKKWGPLQHYMIYLDSFGCLEVIATSVELITVEDK